MSGVHSEQFDLINGSKTYLVYSWKKTEFKTVCMSAYVVFRIHAHVN